jgi:hypothetical protein
MEWTQKHWKRSVEEFPEFLEPLVSGMGRSERREGAALYVQGLLIPGERKSIEPMAARLGTDRRSYRYWSHWWRGSWMKRPAVAFRAAHAGAVREVFKFAHGAVARQRPAGLRDLARRADAVVGVPQQWLPGNRAGRNQGASERLLRRSRFRRLIKHGVA